MKKNSCKNPHDQRYQEAYRIKRFQTANQTKYLFPDVLRLMLGREMKLDSDQIKWRRNLPERHQMLAVGIMNYMFQIDNKLNWVRFGNRFTDDGWRKTSHAELITLTKLSEHQVERGLPELER